MEPHPYFTKIGASGEVLPREATVWEAVLDTRTKPALMWALKPIKVANGKEKTLAAAIKKCTAAGFSDWRLPTVEELFPLADRTKVGPAIDAEFFPDTPSDWFWTSTPDAESPSDFAWGVYFSYGNSYRIYRNINGFVRAVRVGQ